jgi:integrase
VFGRTEPGTSIDPFRFRRLTARASLPPIRFHDLRHVAATISLQAGVDIKVV